MIKNIFKTALKYFWKNRIYNIINLAGLTISISAIIIILLFIGNEQKYDTQINNRSQIYRMGTNWATMPSFIGHFLKDESNYVEDVTRVKMEDLEVSYNNEVFLMDNIGLADANFFSTFNFKFLQGNSKNAIQKRHSIVLTQREAKRIFGKTNPINQTILLKNQYPFTVTGVVENPDYFHLPFSAIATLESLKELAYPEILEQKDGWSYFTYIVGKQSLTMAQTEESLNNKMEEFNYQPFKLTCLEDLYFAEPLYYEGTTRHGNKSVLYILFSIAILILTLACINYINLSTAISEKKIKENSVRKILGSTKTQLIRTSLTKSVLISVIATVFAIVVLYLILPLFNNLTQKKFSLDFTNPLYIFILLLIPLLIGLASGIYPATFIASFSLSNIKKNSSNINSWQRKGLIVLQFSFSIGLIIATLTSFKQVQFIRQKDLGFDKEHTIHFYLDVNNSEYKTIKERLLKITGVEMVAGKNDFSPTIMNMSQVLWPGINETELFVQNNIDEDFFPLLKVSFIKGNNFTNGTDKQQGIIINKRAQELIGSDNPIGMKLTIWERQFRVVGVIDNAHFWTLCEDIHPEFYVYSPNTQNFFVRFRGNSHIPVQQVIGQIQTTIKEMLPSLPFDYKFMDDTYARLYDNDQRVGKIFSIMAVIAILISCMGLFGLSIFNSEKRIKEIGVRKVNGAKISEVITMLNKDFVKWIAIAFVIATPIAWFVMHK